jgi:hypothetical protein
LQAQVFAMQAQVQQLSQDRSATSTHGNGGGNGGSSDRGPLKCFKCGGPHLKKDCPMSDSEASRTKSGLNSVDWDKLTALIKVKIAELPERSSIPDEPTLSIELNGVIVSKYCRHCARYTKSSGMHSTSEHKGTRKFAYVPPAPAVVPPAPAPETMRPPVAARLAQVSPPASVAPGVSFAAGTMFRAVPHTTYDFEGMGTREDDSDVDLVDSVPRSFLSFLGGSPDPSVKGHGR